MSVDSLAKIIATTRLLSQFTSENTNIVKQWLFEQLNCTTECEFLCKLLPLAAQLLLSDDKIHELKEKTTSIAKQQCISQSFRSSETNPLFSTLSTDIIAHMGSFLKIEDSISFGCLNRSLYIDTHNTSYLMKRSNNLTVEIAQPTMDRLILAQRYSNPHYYHAFPNKLSLDCDWNQYHNNSLGRLKSWCESLFRNVNELNCNCSHLPFIPISTVFPLTKLRVSLYCHYYTWTCEDEYHTHCQTVTNHVTQFIQHLPASEQAHRRRIKALEIDINEPMKPLLFALSHECEELTLGRALRHKTDILVLNNIAEFNQIFHCNLRKLSMVTRNSPFLEVTTINLEKEFRKQIKGQSHVSLSNALKHLEFGIRYLSSNINNLANVGQMLRDLDLFNTRQTIDTYEISMDISGLNENYHELSFDSNATMIRLLNQIFIDDCDKRQALKTIIFRIDSPTDHLHTCLKIFSYLCNNRDKIVKNIENTIETIIFKWKCAPHRGVLRSLPPSFSPLLKHYSYTTYSIHETEMVIDSCDLSCKVLGTIYYKIFYWFQSIAYRQYGNDNVMRSVKIRLKKKTPNSFRKNFHMSRDD